MRMNFVIGQRALRLRDDVVGGTLDTVCVSVVAGPSYQLELNSEAEDAADRVEWRIEEDEFRNTPIARRLLGEWGIGRLAVVERDQRPPTFLASFTREGAAMRLVNAEGRLLAYLSLNTSVVIQPPRFPADPNVVRAVVGDIYRRDPERVLELVPCRAWQDAITGELIPIRDSLLPFSGWVYYIADGGELFPCCEAVVVKPQLILFVVFNGCQLLVYRLTQQEAGGILDLLRRARG